MSDGAHLGVTADRALQTILGGEPPPKTDGQPDRAAMERHIRAAADPMTNPAIVTVGTP